MGEELENTKKQLQECEESKKELQETLQSAISNQETTESKYKILASEIQKIEEDLETVKKELSLWMHVTCRRDELKKENQALQHDEPKESTVLRVFLR